MSLFLDEKTKEENAKKFCLSSGYRDLGHIHGYQPDNEPDFSCVESYLAGWNECEKHVRESVRDAADLRSCMCSRFIIEIEQLKAKNEHLKLTTIHFFKKGHAIAKASSLIEIEQLKAENAEKDKEMAAWKKQCIETEKESKLRGEIIQSLEAQIKERDEALIDLFELLSHAFAFQTNGDDWEKQGIAIEKHQSLINKIKESGK